MVGYVISVWKLHHFWMSLVRADLRRRYRGSVLGLGWSLLNPLAMSIVVCTVFSQLFNADIRTYGPFLLCGFACWNFCLATAMEGCQCFFQGEPYIRQYPAPLAIYPLRITLGAMIHMWLALSIVIVLSWALHGFGNLPALLSLLPTAALLLIFGWTLALLLGMANVMFQDMQHLIQILFQVLFYLTPIMYPPEMLRERKLAWMLDYNPFAAFLELIRTPILEGHFPAWDTYLQAGGFTLAALVLASAVLARMQKWLVFYL